MQLRQTHPGYSAQEQTSPIALRPMIGPAQVADPSLALLPRQEPEFFVLPIDEGLAIAIGIVAAAGKMPKPNGAPGKNRRQGSPSILRRRQAEAWIGDDANHPRHAPR